MGISRNCLENHAIKTSSIEDHRFKCISIKMNIHQTLCCLLALPLLQAIELTEKLIPSHAIKGEDVVLECLYDMQGDSLYSVKWYRNGQEFYRHIPTDRPQTVVFKQPGLIVDEYKSTESHLVLRNVDLTTSGKFRCEVSGEAPLFQTATFTNVLIVVDLPDDGPVISGTQPMYNKGDILTANCTSFNSFPAATLNWYINGQVAPHRLLTKYQVATYRTDLTTSTLGLRLKIEKGSFSKSGDLKIKCTATIDPIYWKSNEKLIQRFPERSYITFWNSAAVPYSSSSQQISMSILLYLCLPVLTSLQSVS